MPCHGYVCIFYCLPQACHLRNVLSTKCVSEAKCLATVDEHGHGDSDSDNKVSWNEYMLEARLT